MQLNDADKFNICYQYLTSPKYTKNNPQKISEILFPALQGLSEILKFEANAGMN